MYNTRNSSLIWKSATQSAEIEALLQWSLYCWWYNGRRSRRIICAVSTAHYKQSCATGHGYAKLVALPYFDLFKLLQVDDFLFASNAVAHVRFLWRNRSGICTCSIHMSRDAVSRIVVNMEIMIQNNMFFRSSAWAIWQKKKRKDRLYVIVHMRDDKTAKITAYWVSSLVISVINASVSLTMKQYFSRVNVANYRLDREEF